MKKNINKKGRITRILVAFLFIVLYFVNIIDDSLINVIFASVTVAMIISAMTQYCPLFHFLDYDQNSKKKRKFKY